MSNLAEIYEYGVDHRIQQAQRADGQWFERHQGNTPRGYRWSKWRPVGAKSDRAGLNATAGKARLPR